jgi:hypothetical protein
MNLDTIDIDFPYEYAVLVAAITLLLRVIISWMRAYEYKYYPEAEATDKMKSFNSLSLRRRFWIVFVGGSNKDPFPDFWYNTILGAIELSIFPILLKAHQYSIIGAWIGFKSVAQWNAWNKNRYVFNRFLIAHAALVIISWFMMCFVKVG